MSGKADGKKRKPPPRWRRHLVQAELELPPPPASTLSFADAGDPDEFAAPEVEWWQKPLAVGGLVALLVVLLMVTGIALYTAHRDRGLAVDARQRAESLTLRATSSERALHIQTNPRSWSATPDAKIDWPEPPQLLDLYLSVGAAEYAAYAITIDKVDEGRVLEAHRVTPDSNRELRLSLNSSAFGPGEYRIRLQGYTWPGDRVDAGWVRLVVR